MKNKDNFLIGNEIIELAISVAYENDTPESNDDACEVIRQRMNEDGHFILPVEMAGEDSFRFLTLPLDKGGDAFVAFTSVEQAEKGAKASFLSHYISTTLEVVLRSPCEGLLLNPWGEQFYLPKDVIRRIFEVNQQFGDGRRVSVRLGCELSDGVVDIPEGRSTSDTERLKEYYQSALDRSKAKESSAVILTALVTEGALPGEAAVSAMDSIYRWMDENSDSNLTIVVSCADQSIYESYQTAAALRNASCAARRHQLEKMRATRPKAKKADYDISPMPPCRVELRIPRILSEIDREVLSYGNIPSCMEDKWFWYVSKNRLYAHRSWTGHCIYEIDLSGTDGTLPVTINHDWEQNPWTNLDEAIEDVQCLLNWWIEPEYDYYSEWLDETSRALERQKAKEKKKEVKKPNPATEKTGKYIIKRKEYTATAVVQGKEYIVLKGSGINPNITGVMPDKAMEMRRKGVQEGFLDENFILTKDVVFGSASSSAAFVVGHTVSGPQTWKPVETEIN